MTDQDSTTFEYFRYLAEPERWDQESYTWQQNCIGLMFELILLELQSATASCKSPTYDNVKVEVVKSHTKNITHSVTGEPLTVPPAVSIRVIFQGVQARV